MIAYLKTDRRWVFWISQNHTLEFRPKSLIFFVKLYNIVEQKVTVFYRVSAAPPNSLNYARLLLEVY